MSHDKGRDCARTDEVLENYRQRAIAAESEIERLRKINAGLVRDFNTLLLALSRLEKSNDEVAS